MLLRATADFHGRELIPVFHYQDVMIVDSGGTERTFQAPLKCPAKSDIKISGEGLGGVAEAAGSFRFWQE
jgi:hypothetical protein